MTETKKSGDIPVTKQMLDETRNELKSDIASVKLEMKAGFDEVKSEIKQLTAEVKDQNSKIHRMLTLYEEQEARNKYVLDGHQNLHDRQERFEKEIREEISDIKTVVSKMNTTN